MNLDVAPPRAMPARGWPPRPPATPPLDGSWEETHFIGLYLNNPTLILYPSIFPALSGCQYDQATVFYIGV